MNTRDLEYLVAVAEELHFGRAATRCNVSQPALSGQLRKLEENLGLQLFERTKRYVRLTEDGETILVQARDILDRVNILEQTAALAADPFAGSVTIGMPPTIGPFLTPILLPAVKHYLPSLQLTLVEDLTDRVEAMLVSGDLDLGILATTPAQAALDEVVLYDEPFWVAMPQAHDLAVEDSIDLAKVDMSELMLLSDGHCLRDQIYAACNLSSSSQAKRAEPKTQKTSLATILSLVGAGQGLTLVPAMGLMGGWMTDSGIAFRRIDGSTAGRTIRLTHRKGYHRTALLKKLAGVITGSLPDTVVPRYR